MNNSDLADYYVKNKLEFYGEDAQSKLLVGLKKYIKKINIAANKVVGIDVGCCVGNFIPTLLEICNEDNSNILCFEPNPVNTLHLKEKIKNKRNIKLFECSVSNETKRTILYNWRKYQKNNTGNQLAGLRSGGDKICDTNVKRLDDILDKEFNNENIVIKLLKIDTEGNDGNVIKGLQKYLSKTKYIIFECSDCLDDMRGPNTPNPMRDIVYFLSENQFDTYRMGTKKLFKVNDENWNEIYDDFKFWSNCFAIQKSDDLINDLIDENYDYKY